jgi:hypothetical protein
MGKYIYQVTGLAGADIQTGDYFAVSRSGASPATSFGAKKITTKDLLAGSATSSLIASGISDNTTAIRNLAAGIAADPTAAADVGAGVELIASGTAGQIQYNKGGTPNGFGGSELYYDSANTRLGVNQPSPSYTLDVDGIARIPGLTGDNITGNLITGNNIYANNLFVNDQLVNPSSDNAASVFRLDGFTVGGTALAAFNGISDPSTFTEQADPATIGGKPWYKNGLDWNLWFDTASGTWILSNPSASKTGTVWLSNGSTDITAEFDPSTGDNSGDWGDVTGTSSATSTSNVWLQSASSPNNIYYDGGTVAFGTPSPLDGYSLQASGNPALFNCRIIGSGSSISGIIVTGQQLGAPTGRFDKLFVQTGYITGLDAESINLNSNSESALLLRGQGPGITLSDDSYTNQNKLSFIDSLNRGFNLSYSGAAYAAGMGALTINTVFDGNYLQESLRIYRNGGQVGFGFAGGDASDFDPARPRAPVDISGGGYANLLLQGGVENRIVLGSDVNYLPNESRIDFATGNRNTGITSYVNRLSLVSETTGSLNENLGKNAFEVRSNDNPGILRYAGTKFAVTHSGSTVISPYSYDVDAVLQVNADRGVYIPGVAETGYLDGFHIRGPKPGVNAIKIDIPDRFNSFTSAVSGEYKIKSILYPSSTGYAERVILLHQLYTGEFQHSNTGKYARTGAGTLPSDTGLNIGLAGHTDWTGQKANFCIGELSFLRGGDSSSSVFENVKINTSSAFSANHGYLDGNQYYNDESILVEKGYGSGKWELVTGLFDSTPWMAIKMPFNGPPPQSLYFNGFHKSEGEYGLSGLDVSIGNTFGTPGYTPGQILNAEFYNSYSPFNMRTDFLNDDSNQAFPLLENVFQEKTEVFSKKNLNCGANQETIVSINKSGIGVNLTGEETQAALHIRGLAHEQLYLDTPESDQDAGIRFYEGPASPSNLKSHIFHDASLSGLSIISDSTSGIFITDASGDVGIGMNTPSTQLDVNGIVTATSYIPSDSRIKKNIQPLSNSLSGILNLSGVSFDYRNKNELDSGIISNYESRGKDVPDFFWFGKEEEVGLIAQDVEEVYPNLVHVGNYGMKGVNYAKLVPVLVEAIKEQNQIISGLEQRVSDLEG